MDRKEQPLDSITWVHRDQLKANSYNPNKVAQPELELLKISILEDGWTQPIVANKDYTIVDGYHRWTVSGQKEIYQLTGGQIPVVFTKPTKKSDQQMSTIRHNRARGTHRVIEMSSIVQSMLEDGLTGEQIMNRLGMERDEVTRLLMKKGIPKTDVFKDLDFSKAWNPK